MATRKRVVREMWGCVNTLRHWIYAVHFHRQSSITEFMAGSLLTWADKRKEGWRCVKMKISYPTPSAPTKGE